LAASKKILVTGGTGFIGAALVRSLIQAGYGVRVFDNNSRGSVDRLSDISKDFEFFEGDIRDPDTVQRACEGMNSVAHLAYVNGTEFFYTKPKLVLDVAVRGMLNVLDACQKHEIRDFILASSSEVYQTPPKVPTDETAPLIVPDVMNPRYSYGGGKILCELMAINYARTDFDRMCIFRPHNVYGPQMGWEHVVPQFALRLHDLAKNASDKKTPLEFPIQGDGKQTRAFVYIDDFTDGLMRIIENGKHMQIYHIGSYEELTIGEVAEKIAKQMGYSIKLLTSPAPEGGTLKRVPSIEKLAALGYSPRIPFEKGIQPTLDWYLKNESKRPRK
jgi:nucleoside-diphosphate-sugar epimerase